MTRLIIIFSFFIIYNLSFAQSSPSSPYLQNPELVIGYTDSCANFWLQTWDNQTGGFFTNIDKSGNVITSWGTNKNMLTQTRNAYGMARAYMLTADTTYLGFAKKALDWMYIHAWDTTYGGWYQELNSNGSPMFPNGDKTAFYQHYALLGIVAYYEATRDTTAWNWLMRGYQNLEDHFWDERPGFTGYYDIISFNNQNARNKSFNATVDAVTTHLLYLYLMTKDEIYKERLLEIAEEIKQHFAESMHQQAIGFVEEYDSDWNWNNNETMTIMGHVLKAGWCLARINQLFPDTSYVSTAENLINDVWQNGYDHLLGGPYKDFNRVTGQMLMWGLQDTAKAWWQMEQAIVAGLQMFNLTGESWYMQMADETINFYMQYFVDHEFGEVYADRTRYGGFAWNEAKGNSGKAGYHSIETGYYTYLYGNLFYTGMPVKLNYNFIPLQTDREVLLSPLAINDSSLFISKVFLDGQAYNNYNSASRILNIPAGTGGHFEVTYQQIITGTDTETPIAAMDYKLFQNYPNPFNPVTVIKYVLPEESKIVIKIFDLIGREIETLIDEEKEAGTYEITWNAGDLPSGVYFYQFYTDKNTSMQKKMILLK